MTTKLLPDRQGLLSTNPGRSPSDVGGYQASDFDRMMLSVIVQVSMAEIIDNVPSKLFRPNEAEARMIARLGDQMIRDKLLEAAMRRRDGEVFSITPKGENETLHVYDVMMSAMLDILFAELADGSVRRDRMRRVIESII